MEKIKCVVKLEGYDEINMEFITVPKQGETISYNNEVFEIRIVNHIVNTNEVSEILDTIPTHQEKNILIHASKIKRL
jgi:hypothetical protein